MATSLASATVIARWPTSRVLRALALVATLAVVVAALAVQRELFGPRLLGQTPRLWGAVAAASLAVWWLAGWALPREAAPPEVTLPARTTVRRLAFGGLLAGSLALLTAGLALLYLDLTSPLGARLWLLGLIGLVAAFAAREVPRPRLVPRQRSTADWLWLALAVATVAAAFALRLYRLEAIPASFNNDEGETADWGLNVLHQTLLWGQHVATPSSPFHSGWATNPLGGHYLHAVVMQVAGETIFGMRLTSAISGAIGVWLLYLLLWDYVRPWAAVGAALLMAVSHVHLFWSRTGLLQSLMTALATAMLWLMLRGLRSSGYLSFVLAGLLLGATQHLYQGARFLVPVVAFFFLYTAVADRQFVRRRWSHVLAMATSSAIVFAPLGFWYLAHPGELFTRTAAVFIFSNPDYLRGMYPGKDTLGVVIEQLRRSIEGLAFSGDGSLAFYPPRVPLVDPVVGAALLVGILGFTFSLRRPERVLVGLWAWLTILIACTSTVDPPPMTRLILMVPALFFVVGVVLDRLGRLAEQAAGRRGLVALALPLVVALGYAAVWNYHVFFVAYPRDFPTGVWTAAGNLARTLGPSSKTYMVGPPELYFLNSTVRFLTRGLAGDDLPEKDIPVRERGYRDGLFIVSPALPNALARLRTAYPNGQLQEHRDSRGNLLFTAYRVDAATLNAAAGPDAPYRQYDLRFGMRGKGFGQFENGRALAVDAQGRIYVADVGNGRIDVFDATGRPVGVVGKPGSGDGEFRQVWAVAVAPDGTILGLDRETRWIQRFDPTGRWVGKLGGPAQLVRPEGVAVAPDGSVLVVDGGQHALVRFGADGALLGRVGAPGSGPGQLQGPVGVAAGPDGRVYVVDGGNTRVEVFDAGLGYLGEWKVARADANLGPQVAVAERDEGAVYVVDPHGGQVQRYTRDGLKEWAVGMKGDGPLQFLLPVGVATDRAGNVYILDTQRHRMYRFDVPRRPR